MFTSLTAEQEADYRKWARENYTPLTAISPVWHPVVQIECINMNIEHTGYKAADLFVTRTCAGCSLQFKVETRALGEYDIGCPYCGEFDGVHP